MNEEQLSVCKKFGSAYIEALDKEIVGVALETLDKEPIYGLRIMPTDNTTGWYICGGPYSDAPDFYQPVCLSHLKERCPTVVKYLSLKPGFKFLIDRAGYEDVWKDPGIIGQAAK
jgi:hypothetical protein